MRLTPALRITGLTAAFALVLGAAYAPPAPAAASPTAHAARADSTWQWPERSQNLRVLPDTTGAATLRRTMQGFTRGLGVRCSECHVGSGPDFNTWDFASDAKPHKEVARGMMRLTAALNADLVPAALGRHTHDAPAPTTPTVHRHADGSDHVHRAAPTPAQSREHDASPAAEAFVSCWTCHRGQSHPEPVPPARPSSAR